MTWIATEIQKIKNKKVGWETMGCCKTKEQFDKEAEFFATGERVSF